jgi:hypothetical protein
MSLSFIGGCQTTAGTLNSIAPNSLQLVLFGARQILRLTLGFLAAQPVGDRAAAGVVIPIEILALATIPGSALRSCGVSLGDLGSCVSERVFARAKDSHSAPTFDPSSQKNCSDRERRDDPTDHFGAADALYVGLYADIPEPEIRSKFKVFWRRRRDSNPR